MYELFSELGKVVYCRITMDKETGKSRGELLFTHMAE